MRLFFYEFSVYVNIIITTDGKKNKKKRETPFSLSALSNCPEYPV